MSTIKDYRIKLSADLVDFEKGFATLGTKFKAVFGGIGETVKHYGEFERAQRIEITKVTIEELDKVVTASSKAAKAAAAEGIKIAQDTAAEKIKIAQDAADAAGKIESEGGTSKKANKTKSNTPDPDLLARLEKQKAAEADYFAAQDKLRKAGVKEAETDGIFQYGNTKKRLLAEADLQAANVKRLEALRDTAISKAAGNAEKEFKIRTQFEAKITKATVEEAKKRDAATEVKSRKMKGSAEFGENISTIAGGGLAQMNFSGLGAMAGDMLGGPIGGAVGAAIGQGVEMGMKVADMLMDKFDPGRLFAAATKRAQELKEKSVEVGDAVKTIGQNISMGDVDAGIETARKSMEAIKAIEPEIGANLELFLNMPGAKTVEDLQQIKSIMEETQNIAKNDIIVKQMEAADNAMGAAESSLGALIREADDSIALFNTQTTNYSKQQGELDKLNEKQKTAAGLTTSEYETKVKLTSEVSKLKNAQEQVNVTFERIVRTQLQMAEKAKGSALTQQEMDAVALQAKKDMVMQENISLSNRNTHLFVEGQIDTILKSSLESFSKTNSIQAENNSHIFGLVKAYDEGNKILKEQLDTTIALNQTDLDKNGIELENLTIKISNLKLVDDALAAQEAAIQAAIAAQEGSVDAENKRIEAADILAKKELEIKQIMEGSKTEVSAMKQVQLGDLQGSLRTIQKQRGEVQKALDSANKSWDKAFKEKFDSKGMAIKEGGGGGGGGEDPFEAMRKKVADDEKKQAEEARKQQTEALKDQLRLAEEANKAKLDEAQKIKEATQQRVEAEKALAQHLTEFAKDLQDKVKSLRETHFQDIGGILSKFITPFSVALIESAKIVEENTEAVANLGKEEQKRAKELEKTQAEAGKASEEVHQAKAEKNAAEVRIKEIETEVSMAKRFKAPESAAMGQMREIINQLKNMKGQDYTAEDSSTYRAGLKAVGVDLGALFGTIEQQDAIIENAVLSAKAKLVDLKKENEESEDYKNAVENNTRAVLVLESEKNRLNTKLSISTNDQNKATDAATKAREAIKNLGGEIDLIDKSIVSTKEERKIAELASYLKLYNQIYEQRSEILELQKSAEAETDPDIRAKALLETAKKSKELQDDLVKRKQTEAELAFNINAIQGQILTNAELKAEIDKKSNLQVSIALEGVSELQTKTGILQAKNNLLINETIELNKITYTQRLKDLDAAREEGKLQLNDIDYLREKAGLLERGAQDYEGLIAQADEEVRLRKLAVDLRKKLETRAKTDLPKLHAQAGGIRTSDIGGPEYKKLDVQENLRKLEKAAQEAEAAADAAHLKINIVDVDNARKKVADARHEANVAKNQFNTAEKAAQDEEKKRQDDLLKTLTDTLGLEGEREKINERYNATLKQIADLEANSKITLEEAGKIRETALVKKTAELNKILTDRAQTWGQGLAGAVDEITNAAKDFEGVINAKSFQEGAGAAIDLVQLVGNAMLNFKGDPSGAIPLIGAVVVGGALIAKAINTLYTMFAPVQVSKEDAAKKEAEAAKRLIDSEKRLLELEQLRVQAKKDLADLGDSSVDQAYELLAAEKEAHTARLAHSAEARQLAGLTAEQLTTLKAITAEQKLSTQAKKDALAADLTEAERIQGTGDRAAMKDFLRSHGLDYGLVTAKGMREYIDGTKADMVKIDSTLSQIEGKEGNINAELEWRKNNIALEKQILEYNLSLIELRAKIEGDSIQHAEAVRQIKRRELEDALALANINFAGLDDTQLKKLLETSNQLSDSAIAAANAWLDADKAVTQYANTVDSSLFDKQKKVLQAAHDLTDTKYRVLTSPEYYKQMKDLLEAELNRLIEQGKTLAAQKAPLDQILDNRAAQYGIEKEITDLMKAQNGELNKEDTILTGLIRKHQQRLEALRQAAGGSISSAQQSELAGIRAEMVAELTKTGATPTEIQRFLDSLPKFEEGGIVPGTPGQPVQVTAHAGEVILPADITSLVLKALNNPYSGGSRGINLLGTDEARYLGESMRSKEAAIYNINNNINVIVNQKNNFATMEPQQAISALGSGLQKVVFNTVNRGIESGNIDTRRN